MALISRLNPVFPAWSKLRSFEIHTLREHEVLDLSSDCRGTAIFIERGRLFVTEDGKETMMQAWQAPSNGLSFSGGSLTATTYSSAGYWMDRCTFYVFRGDWEEAELGTFRVSRCDSGLLREQPAYRKNTLFPSHSHDFEQAWLLLSGHACVRLGEESLELAPGELAVTQAGLTHDFADAHEYCEGMYINILR